MSTELEAPLLALFRYVQKLLGHGMSCCALPCGWAACCTPSCGFAKAKAVEGGRGLPRSRVRVLALSGSALLTRGPSMLVLGCRTLGEEKVGEEKMGEDKVGEECPPTVPGHRILSVCLIQKFSHELVSGTSHSSHSRSPAFGTMLRTAITAGEPMWAEER